MKVYASLDGLRIGNNLRTVESSKLRKLVRPQETCSLRLKWHCAMNTPFDNAPAISGVRALLLDLDGTLVDDIYEHPLAWQEAFEESGHCIGGVTNS